MAPIFEPGYPLLPPQPPCSSEANIIPLSVSGRASRSRSDRSTMAPFPPEDSGLGKHLGHGESL